MGSWESNLMKQLDVCREGLEILKDENTDLRQANRNLGQQLEDWEDTVKGAMHPKADEVHCTCCPALRAEVKRLTKVKEELEKKLEKCQGAFSEACRVGPIR